MSVVHICVILGQGTVRNILVVVTLCIALVHIVVDRGDGTKVSLKSFNVVCFSLDLSKKNQNVHGVV